MTDPAEHERKLNAAYYNLFTGDLGTEVLADLREAFFDVVPFSIGVDVDVSQLAMFEGTRYVVAYILERIEHHKTHLENPTTTPRRRANRNGGYA